MSEKTCRICLKQGEKRESFQSSCETYQKVSYAEMYTFICDISPLNDPQFLCSSCASQLVTAFEFRKRLEENEKALSCIKQQIGKQVFNLQTEMILFEANGDLLTTENLEFETMNTGETDYKSTNAETEEIQCPLCSYKANDKPSYRKHVKRLHYSEKLSCDFNGCMKTFRLVYNLMKHRRNEHGSLHDLIVLDEEKQKISSNKKKPCPHCNQIFLNDKILRQHCNAKHLEKKYGCPDCEERFSLSYHLKKHRRIVHNYQPENATTICGYCGKLCNQKSLDSHIRNIHFKSDTEFTCDLCQVKVSTKPGLINHMRSKHMELIYNCRYCKESFSNYSCRRTHEVRFHTFDYKFTCNFCPKKFMERVQLRKHIATHTGERRYRCEICSMGFITLTNLKLHLASHSEERPHICKVCNASFKTRMALKKHDRIHNERDYECPVCFLKYLVNQQLRLHIKRNHPDYPLPPPGTVMSKSALKRINAVTEKYKVQVSPSVGLSSRKSNI